MIATSRTFAVSLLLLTGCQTVPDRLFDPPSEELGIEAPSGADDIARQQIPDRAIPAGKAVSTEPRPEANEAAAGSGYAALQPLAAYAVEQEGLLAEFEETAVQAYRDRDAYVLSELWKAGMLRSETKDALAEHHYSLVLLQVYGNYQAPNFVVRCHQTFPFPDLWVEFTPKLYINGEAVWAPYHPQRGHAMSLNNSTIASRIGGVVRNGDVVQYEVEITEKTEGGEPWRTTVWSNKVVAQGLKQ